MWLHSGPRTAGCHAICGGGRRIPPRTGGPKVELPEAMLRQVQPWHQHPAFREPAARHVQLQREGGSAQLKLVVASNLQGLHTQVSCKLAAQLSGDIRAAFVHATSMLCQRHIATTGSHLAHDALQCDTGCRAFRYDAVPRPRTGAAVLRA